MSSVPSLDTLKSLPGKKIFCIFTNQTMNVGVKTQLKMEICSVAEVLEQVEDISLSKSHGNFSYNMCLRLFVFIYLHFNNDFFLLRYRVCSFQ